MSSESKTSLTAKASDSTAWQSELTEMPRALSGHDAHTAYGSMAKEKLGKSYLGKSAGKLARAYAQYHPDIIGVEQETHEIPADELAARLVERSKDVSLVKGWADKRVSMAKRMSMPMHFAWAVLLKNDSSLNPNEYDKMRPEDLHEMRDLMPRGNKFKDLVTLRARAKKDAKQKKAGADKVEENIKIQYEANKDVIKQLAIEDARDSGHTLKYPDQD